MNWLFKLLGVIVLGISLYLGWYWQSYNHFISTPVSLSHTSVEFVVPSGASVSSISQALVAKGIIEDAFLFSLMARFKGQEANIKAGEYTLSQGMLPEVMLSLFIQGKVKQYVFTIIEGWSFRQLMIALGGSPHLTHHLKNKSPSEVMAIIGFAGEHPEGRFLPDTYHFPNGTSDIQFLVRAYKSMSKVLETEWAAREISIPLKNVYEALILASIVEKETGAIHERKQIAGVFTRRLNKNMRLQTDPTVIYGMGERYEGNLRKKDLKADTPYNTYRRKGLPPTPIAMPGKAAINAVLHPAKEKTLYFVAKGDGSHYFSETLKEHNKAVRKYQILQRKANYRSSPSINQ